MKALRMPTLINEPPTALMAWRPYVERTDRILHPWRLMVPEKGPSKCIVCGSPRRPKASDFPVCSAGYCQNQRRRALKGPNLAPFVSCSECGEKGHNRRTCPKLGKPARAIVTCRKCGVAGHTIRTCGQAPETKASREPLRLTCERCGVSFVGMLRTRRYCSQRCQASYTPEARKAQNERRRAAA
jgi:hypothetical protein